MAIGPYGTYALYDSNANHLRPTGTFHTASIMLPNKQKKVETLIQIGRLRNKSENRPNATVVTNCTAYCVVGMMFVSSTE